MSGILNAYTGGTYSGLPGAPTIGTATATGATTATVAFTAPSNTGGTPITGYQALSSPGGITATGSSSPISVTGLSGSTTYTFQVRAQNAIGYGAYSGSSNSITTSVAAGSQAFTTVGTFTWVAPTGVTSVSAVGISGASSKSRPNRLGGTLAYINNSSTTPGSSYTVVVGNGCVNAAGDSSFLGMVAIGGGKSGQATCSSGTWFNLGSACQGGSGGGYVNNGCHLSNYANPGQCGVGGSGGGGGKYSTRCCGGGEMRGASGGTGIYGQGSNGSSGGYHCCQCNLHSNYGAPGGGGSGGTAGGATYSPPSYTNGAGGSYGGTGGASVVCSNWGGGAQGAVRIVWPGSTRTFPSTCVGSP